MDFFASDFPSILNSLPSAGNPFSAMFTLFMNGGWIIFVLVTIWGSWQGWKEYVQNKYDMSLKFILLAVDIPKENEQSPKAVEHIFAHLYGIRKKGTLKKRFIDGYNQPGISLEIVSIEGYIQFLVRTPVKFRDLVEAAIYAQYPDAEITEVEDYINTIPKPMELPHPKLDIWGSEFKLTNNEVYPIRTYPYFEHSLSQKFMDPMASLLEIFSRMGPGEQLWMQFVIGPVDQKWRQKGIAVINKLIGKKSGKKGKADLGFFPREITRGLAESFTASVVPPTEMQDQRRVKQEREWPSMMQHLSPDEKEIVESVGMKIAKLGFKTKIRMIYSAPHDKFDTGKGVYAVAGAFQQFSTQHLNGLKINKKTRTKVHYLFTKIRVLARKRRILWAYRYRSMKRGRLGYILNTEELATLWHFPVIEAVKTPSVQTVDAKKAQPPSELPMESHVPPIKKEPITTKGKAPSNLPTN